MISEASGCYIVDDEYNVISVNEAGRQIYPQLQVGKKCYECLMDRKEPCGPCPVKGQVEGPRVYVDPIRHISEMVDKVDVELPGHGCCHALVFSTVASEEAFAATLPKSRQGLRNLALIKALTLDFYDVFSVRMADRKVTVYRHNGQNSEVPENDRQALSYDEVNERYIQRFVLPQDREMVRADSRLESMAAAMRENESATMHYRVLLDGQLHYFYRKIVRIGSADDFEHLVIGVASEDETVLSREKNLELQKRLSRMEYDAETNLLIKEAFFIQGGQLLEKHPDKQFDLCILKIENLGLINHQYGRQMGDRLVRLIGHLLKPYESETMRIAYMGGSDFVSISQSAPQDERKASIYRFREDILRQSEIKNLNLKWSIFKGVRRDIQLEEVYEKTNYALSTIRANSHQDFIEFDQSVIDRLEWEEYVEEHFQQALRQGEFVVWYQPKFSVHTREICGAQALVRWITAEGETVPPSRFIPVLEKSGLINLLDEAVFRQVCAFQKNLHEKGLPEIPVSVNLSRASIFTREIAERYDAIARKYQVSPRLIPIEITESAAVRAAAIRDFAASLMEKGFSLHMDDFGAGYSSLSSLQVIPFESIKLDKSLVDYIGERRSESLIKHTIQYAKESGMTVVAEGVETLEQYMFLKVVGCDVIQGYYFSGPLESMQFMEQLAEK